jgi:hypothetical protein
MILIFCDSVVNSKEVDSDYQNEYESAKEHGLETALFSFENLSEKNITSALQFIKAR